MKIRLKESDSERPQKRDRDGMPDQVYQGLHHNFTTPVKLWKRQNITKMKRKKAGKKITYRAQREIKEEERA